MTNYDNNNSNPFIDALDAAANFDDQSPEQRMTLAIMMTKWAVNESQQAWQEIKNKNYN